MPLSRSLGDGLEIERARQVALLDEKEEHDG
jgi:hypothetical protein